MRERGGRGAAAARLCAAEVHGWHGVRDGGAWLAWLAWLAYLGELWVALDG